MDEEGPMTTTDYLPDENLPYRPSDAQSVEITSEIPIVDGGPTLANDTAIADGTIAAGDAPVGAGTPGR